MKTVIVTGANRGLGLEFCHQYLERGDRVIATCREPEKATKLSALSKEHNMSVYRLDIGDNDSIEKFRKAHAEIRVDILVNNAGVYGGSPQNLENCDPERWLETIRINALAPLLFTRAIMPLLEKVNEPKVAFLTSKLGSMGDNESGGAYIYRTSKAALNAGIKSLSIDFADKFKTIALHPGWVRTDMGGPNGLIDVEESVSGLIQIIEQLDSQHSGAFLDYQGKEVPW